MNALSNLTLTDPLPHHGGDLATMVRQKDWSTTPLGPMDSWPASLRIATEMCLGSRFPMVIWWGPRFVLIYNDAYAEMIGGKHPAALGAPAQDVWPEVWEAIGPDLQTVLDGGPATWSESRRLLLNRHGYLEECFFTVSTSPIPHDGQVGGLLSTTTEITNRVVSARRLNALRILAEHTSNPSDTADVLRTTAATLVDNAADVPFAAVYRRVAEQTYELVSQAGLPESFPSLPARCEGADPDPRWPIVQAAVTGEAVVLDDLPGRFGLTGDSAPEVAVPSQAVVLPVVESTGEGVGVVLVAGASPYRALDDDYRSFFNLIANQVSAAVTRAQVYEAERRRAEALVSIDRAKTKFIGRISHEFRAQLAMMLRPLGAVLDNQDDLPPKVRRDLENLQRSALPLQRVANALLDISRIDASGAHAHKEPTDVAELTRQLIGAYQAAAEHEDLRVIVDCPPLSRPVYVDPEMWEEIVLNLVSNAIKFTPKGEVEVRLCADGDDIVLTVRDTGSGIADVEVPHLFDRLHRPPSVSGQGTEGNGIGLALVKELVALHGGDIDVTSQPGSGSMFRVRIPFGAPPPTSAATSGSEPSTQQPSTAATLPEETSGARILVADANPEARNYVTRVLGERWQVEAVVDGRAVLEAVRQRPPDLLVADVALPDLNGLNLVAELRQDERLRDLPIVLLSARAHEDDVVEALRRGANDYLVKPFAARQLEARAAAHLALTQLRREAVRQLHESEQRFRLLTDTAQLMIWISGPDGRLIDLNDPFLDYTGRTLEESLGDGWLDAMNPGDRERCEPLIRQAVAERRPIELEYRLRRADGTYGWILHRGVPIFDADRGLTGFVGSFSDISAHRESEERLRRVQALTAALSRALTPDQVALATVDYGMRAVGASAAWLTRVDSEDRTLRLLQTGGSQPRLWPRLAGVRIDTVPALHRVVTTGEAIWLESAEAIRRELALPPEADVPGALAVLPVLIDSVEPGCLGLCLPDERSFSDMERDDARLVARLADQALARAGRYAAERRVARTLQRNLLPHHLAEIDGVAAAAKYLPGTGEVEVGGDWYQLLPLPDNRIAVVVGDVAGHGIQAAVTMGILRNALNAYLLEGHNPAEALERTSRLLEHANERTMATTFCGILDRATRRFHYSTAGHPPPVLKGPDGSVRLLDGPKRVPLGLSTGVVHNHISSVDLPVGSVLIGYTDGLVERRRESLDLGLDRLVGAVRTGPEGVNELGDHLINRLTGPDHDDDIALLVLRLTPRRNLELSLDADATYLSGIRSVVAEWLDEHRVPAAEVQDVVLAVGESCANAILHAYGSEGDPKAKLQLKLRLEGETVHVHVRDWGAWRESGRATGGRGIPIMRQVMDAVDITVNNGGTTVDMRRRLTIGRQR